MDSFVIKLSTAESSQPTVAIKDSIDVAGIPTRLGSRACLDQLPAPYDAAVTKHLKQSGFSIYGKTVMHELAFGMTGVNSVYGTPINPLYPNLIPGGSSSGSAAVVAAGQVDVAIGTDTGGSVRLPAACCGIYGLKPTFGLVSRKGVWPSNSSLDCVGVFARTPEFITKVMQVICSNFDAKSARQAVAMESNLKVGWITVESNSDILDVTQKTILDCPFIDLVEERLPLMDAAFQAGLTIINRETWLACEDLFATGKLGDDVAKRLEKASHTTDADVAKAESVRTAFTKQVDQALEKTRVIALPTLPHFPMTIEEALAGKTDVTISKLVRPFNLSGHPAISIPCSSQLGLPIGLQLVGRKNDDAFLCALSERIAKAFH